MESERMSGANPVDTDASPFARWRTLPRVGEAAAAPNGIRLTGGFWTERQTANRDVSLPSGYRMLEAAGNLHDLRLAAGRASGPYRGPMFMDSDVYKWLEAAAYELGQRPDPELKQLADSVIELVEAAQGPDGYLDSYWQIVEPERRWADLSHGHELYCAGHLIQAAVAFDRANGDARLLAVARRFADYIDSVFGPGKRAGTPGHPEIELALVELYRHTGERRYLDLARFFVDERGKGLLGPGRHGGAAYYQDHEPVREAQTVEGHAVRALYLTSGIADLYLETGEEALLRALERQWADLTQRKMYVTGGVGSRHLGEAFGEPYELPNERAYCETCAAIANVMWNWRMLLATGAGRFADILERSLYNAVLSGISLDGCRYFYVNPLLSYGAGSVMGRKSAERTEWHACACCPPNVMRLLASLDHYLATTDPSGVQIHLYAPAEIQADVAGHRVQLTMQTDYPWDGQVRLTVARTEGAAWTLRLRIPAWASGATLRVNGAAVERPAVQDGYAALERRWKSGDVVEIGLPMEARLVEAHPYVDAARGAVAIERGPLVYCLEQTDQAPDVGVLDARISETAPLRSGWRPDLLGGIVTVEADGEVADPSAWADRLYAPVGATSEARRPAPLVAIPYYSWANRGPAAMRVWIPRA